MASKKFSLKGLFLEDSAAAGDSSGATQSPASAPQPAAQSLPPRRPGAGAGVSSPVPASAFASGVPDEKSLAILEKAVAEANQEGYDYLEFRTAVEQQKAIIPDEKIRFQAALAAASVMNVTAAKLVESAQYYTAVLKAKERDFREAQDAAMRKEVGGRQEQISGAEKEIAQKATQVSELTKQIAELQQRKSALQQEMADQKSAIEQIQSGFYSTLKAVTDRIDADVAKVKNYLMSA